METKVNLSEYLFLQSRTSDYHYSSENTLIVIEDVKMIKCRICYYIKWIKSGKEKYNWFTEEDIEWVCKAHEKWLGNDSDCFKKWNKILQDIKKGSV